MRRADQERVRAWVDGELSADEQALLQVRLRQDPTLAEELQRMRAVRLQLRALAYVPLAPPRFQTPPTAARQARPLVFAMAAAAAVCVGIGLIWTAWQPSASPPQTTIASSAPAPSDGRVVDFTYHAPEAARVQVAGDFSNWKPITLDHVDGRWSARLILVPGRYTYMYVVDGRWTTDPKAHSFRDDEYGRRNAVLHL